MIAINKINQIVPEKAHVLQAQRRSFYFSVNKAEHSHAILILLLYIQIHLTILYEIEFPTNAYQITLYFHILWQNNQQLPPFNFKHFQFNQNISKQNNYVNFSLITRVILRTTRAKKRINRTHLVTINISSRHKIVLGLIVFR